MYSSPVWIALVLVRGIVRRSSRRRGQPSAGGSLSAGTTSPRRGMTKKRNIINIQLFYYFYLVLASSSLFEYRTFNVCKTHQRTCPPILFGDERRSFHSQLVLRWIMLMEIPQVPVSYLIQFNVYTCFERSDHELQIRPVRRLGLVQSRIEHVRV